MLQWQQRWSEWAKNDLVGWQQVTRRSKGEVAACGSGEVLASLVSIRAQLGQDRPIAGDGQKQDRSPAGSVPPRAMSSSSNSRSNSTRCRARARSNDMMVLR